MPKVGFLRLCAVLGMASILAFGAVYGAARGRGGIQMGEPTLTGQGTNRAEANKLSQYWLNTGVRFECSGIARAVRKRLISRAVFGGYKVKPYAALSPKSDREESGKKYWAFPGRF